MAALKTIFGDPVRWPRRRVIAYTGAFASDYLGDFKSPAQAARLAREYGYKIVHVMYRNGEADAIDLT